MACDLALRLALLASTTACGGADTRTAPAFTARDSAGISIISSSTPAWSAADQWRVGAAPTLEIGRLEGAEDYLLSRVADVRRLGDGTIVVANGGSGELRYYDASGAHLRSVGGRGEGPEEFTSISWLRRLAGDSLAVYDSQLRRLSFFAPDGGFIRSVTLATTAEARRRHALGLFADGSVLARAMLYDPPAKAADAEVHHPREAFLHLSAVGELLDTVAVLPGQEEVWANAGPFMLSVPVFYGSAPVAAVGPDFAYLGSGETFEIGAYTPGGVLQRVLRRMGPPRPLPPEESERMRRTMLEGEDNPTARAGLLRALETMPAPARLPPYRTLIVDDAGFLWVEEHPLLQAEQTTWIVFDPQGWMLGSLPLPARFRPRHIGRDFVIGIARDDLDVERVQLYALER